MPSVEESQFPNPHPGATPTLTWQDFDVRILGLRGYAAGGLSRGQADNHGRLLLASDVQTEAGNQGETAGTFDQGGFAVARQRGPALGPSFSSCHWRVQLRADTPPTLFPRHGPL